jgi:uncharacterized protein (DUF1684 family)
VPAASLDRHAPARDTPAVTPTDENAREVEESRESYREWLSGPESFLAAVARHELPVGKALRFGEKGDVELAEAGAAVTIAATDDGFRVDGFKRGPGIVRLGRYRLRLSHQNAPAVVIIDPDAKRERMTPRWFAYASGLRFILALEPDPEKIALESTRERDRAAERVGWFTFSVEGRECRVAATRLLEPGVPEDSLQIFFKDRTNGRESYQIGRYLDLDALDDGGYLVDFNRAYNPACAFSPHYNCPVPPPQNRLVVAIRAGEMTPES